MCRNSRETERELHQMPIQFRAPISLAQLALWIPLRQRNISTRTVPLPRVALLVMHIFQSQRVSRPAPVWHRQISPI